MSEPQPPEPGQPGGWGVPEVRSDGFRFNDGSPVPPPTGPATWSPVPQQPPRPPPPGAYPYGPPAPGAYPYGPPAPGAYPYGPPAPGAYPSPQGHLQPQPRWIPSAMPDGPRTYPQLLRGPRRRWWRPLVALLLAGAMALVAQIVALGPFVLFGVIATGGQNLGRWFSDEFDKLAGLQIDAAWFLYINLGLIALVPAAGLSIWAVHHIRPKYVSSVVGGFRWRWLLRCLAVVVPVWIVYTLIDVALERPVADRPAEWVTLLFLVVFMTPLQAAGEEYFFRGWILQNVGSWFKRPMLSLVAGTLVSTVSFSAAHGSPDPWILASLGVFAISCCVLTWRTGGLEAAIAIHAVNNVSAFSAIINIGGWDKAFIGADTKSDPAHFGVDLAIQVIAFALIWWQAKRTKISWQYRPDRPEVHRDGPPLAAPATRSAR